MGTYQQCDVTFRLDGNFHHGTMHIDEEGTGEKMRYRAIIDSSPLRGTYGGFAEDVTLALDFLNLAMQAEGADEIVFTCQPVEQM